MSYDGPFGMDNFFGSQSTPRKRKTKQSKKLMQNVYYIGTNPKTKRKTVRRTTKPYPTRNIGFGEIIAGAKAAGRGAAITYSTGKQFYKKRQTKKFLTSRTNEELKQYRAKTDKARKLLRKEKEKRGLVPEEQKFGFFKKIKGK